MISRLIHIQIYISVYTSNFLNAPNTLTLTFENTSWHFSEWAIEIIRSYKFRLNKCILS